MTRMIDEGHTVDVIYLDFAKAFDSVNHRFLLAKMNSLGLGDAVVRWIKAYLSGRVSRVHVGGEHLGAISMHSDIPQGSVIGPLLFLLFVNDLPDVLETMTLLFADDVKMETRRSQSMSLHISLTATWDWSKKWDLPINTTKYNYLITGREVPLRLSFFPRWAWHPHPCIQISQVPRASDG